ncbi:MAG: DUF2889 domain-containing protein [candidate division Zixibacteria bacterium]|nr:DUF2889 domain-containing protein [candidate division Zixibacteria bacterium]
MPQPPSTPVPPPARRGRFVSKRDISIEIFESPDGLMSVYATFLDPYHLIRLDLTVDPNSKEILAAHAEMANHPHSLCPLVTVKAQELVGLNVGRGVMKEISRRIGGGAGCVHLRELSMEAVNFIATAVIGYDNGYGVMSREFNAMPEEERYRLSKEHLRGTCQIFQGGETAGPRVDSEVESQ